MHALRRRRSVRGVDEPMRRERLCGGRMPAGDRVPRASASRNAFDGSAYCARRLRVDLGYGDSAAHAGGGASTDFGAVVGLDVERAEVVVVGPEQRLLAEHLEPPARLARQHLVPHARQLRDRSRPRT